MSDKESPETVSGLCASCGRKHDILYKKEKLYYCEECLKSLKSDEHPRVGHRDQESHSLKKEPASRSKSPILVIFLILSLGMNGILWFHYDPIIKENKAEIENLNEKLLLLENSLAQKEREYINLQSELEDKTDLLIQKNKEYVELQQESLVKIEEAYERGDKHGYDYGYGIGNREGYSEGFRIGNETGYSTGYEFGIEVGIRGDYKGWGYFIRDPTYNEVLSFIKSDGTNLKKYVSGEFECLDYAFMVTGHAIEKGFRCFIVHITLEGNIPVPIGIEHDYSYHAIIAFNTSDRGIFYIEPQNDCFVDLEIGKHYWNECVISSVTYLVSPSFSDIVLDFRIYGIV